MIVKRGDIVALRVRSIGEAAKLTVSDATGPPRFVHWQPFVGKSIWVSPSMRDSDEELPE